MMTEDYADAVANIVGRLGGWTSDDHLLSLRSDIRRVLSGLGPHGLLVRTGSQGIRSPHRASALGQSGQRTEDFLRRSHTFERHVSHAYVDFLALPRFARVEILEPTH